MLIQLVKKLVKIEKLVYSLPYIPDWTTGEKDANVSEIFSKSYTNLLAEH